MNKVKISEQYSDAELIQKILAGETALFEIVIRRNNPFIYKTGRAYGYNHEDTQDLMQETYIKTYLNLSKFEGRSSLKTWILKIMLNNCFHKQQKLSYKNEIVSTINDKAVPMFSNHQPTDMNKEIANRELNGVIEKALVEIPVDYRMVFSLREVNGLNVAETAEALQISEANVKVRLNRAKVMLRKQLERTYRAEEIFDFNLIYCDAMVERVMTKIAALKM